MQKTRRWYGALLILPLFAGQAACGGEADDAAQVASLADGAAADEPAAEDAVDDDAAGDVAASDDPQEAMLAFAECMREHGIEMPDPQFDGSGPGAGGGFAVELGDPSDAEEFEQAQEECGDLLEDAVGEMPTPDPEQQAEMEEQMLAFAECMREHGVDFPDPQFNDGAVMIGGPGMDPEDADFQDAQEACGELLPGRPGLAADGPATRAGGGA